MILDMWTILFFQTPALAPCMRGPGRAHLPEQKEGVYPDTSSHSGGPSKASSEQTLEEGAQPWLRYSQPPGLRSRFQINVAPRSVPVALVVARQVGEA